MTRNPKRVSQNDQIRCLSGAVSGILGQLVILQRYLHVCAEQLFVTERPTHDKRKRFAAVFQRFKIVQEVIRSLNMDSRICLYAMQASKAYY